MKYSYDGYNWLVRIDKGELLVQNLADLAKSQKIGGAWVNGLGACQWAELGFYDLSSKDYKWHKLSRSLEIVSLQGNISWQNNEPAIHVHAVLSDESGTTYGGHLKELAVSGTCEVLLHRWYQPPLNRAHDEQTGLNLLDI